MVWERVRYFKRDEWPKDPDKVSPNLVLAMDRLREVAGVPILIHVAWEESGHASQSYHYKGQAVDFHFAPGLTHQEEYQRIADLGLFGGVGFYPHWGPRPGWHVDLRKDTLRWVQTKDKTYAYGRDALTRALEVL